MSYTINNTFNPFAFIGQIVAYGGTTDPPGWVICDGGTRVNTGGMYTNLANTGMGSISGGNYIALDLRGHLICGFDNDYPIRTKYTLTNNEITFDSSNIPAHTHGSITTASGGGEHFHFYEDDYFTEDPGNNRSNTASGDGSGFDNIETNTSNPTYTNHVVTIGSQGSNAAYSLQQRSLPINYIIKL